MSASSTEHAAAMAAPKNSAHDSLLQRGLITGTSLRIKMKNKLPEPKRLDRNEA
jgi:hypothetical protein